MYQEVKNPETLQFKDFILPSPNCMAETLPSFQIMATADSRLWLEDDFFFLLPTLSPVYDIVVLLYTSLVWFLVLKL